MAFGFKHGSKNLIKFVAKPTVTGAYTFDNSQKSAVITGYDAKAMTVSGTQQATSSGTYSVTFMLNKGYAWTDKSKDAITLRWTIAKRTVAIPTMTNKSFTYAVNSTFAPTISGVNAYITQSGTASATKAGNYSVTWALVYPNDTVWSDNTTSNKSASWSVAKRSITVPSITSGSFTWAVNKTFAPTITGVDSNYITQTGTVSSTNAGSWTVTWALKSTANTQWSDKTTANKTGTWSVAKLTLTIPSISSAKSFTFVEGTNHSVTIANFNSTYETQSGTTSSSAYSSFTITWKLRYSANTQWSDKTITDKTATWANVWTNGTSHYNNDLYNRGWYKASSLAFPNGGPTWNTDHFYVNVVNLNFCTSGDQTGTFHVLAKVSDTKSENIYTVDVRSSAYGYTNQQAFMPNNTTYVEGSAAHGSGSGYTRFGIRTGNQRGLCIQRVWIT